MEKNKKQIVYLFRQKGTNYVKIGMTTKSDFSDRFTSFCTYAPNGGEVVGIIKCTDSRKLEKEIHDLYKHKRLKGEFFSLSKEECDLILNKYKSDENFDDVLNNIKITASVFGEEFIIKLNKFIKNYNSPKIGIKDNSDIINLFEEDFNSFYTASEICKMLKDLKGIEMNPVRLGMAIGSKFTPIRKRRGHNVAKCYRLKIKE